MGIATSGKTMASLGCPIQVAFAACRKEGERRLLTTIECRFRPRRIFPRPMARLLDGRKAAASCLLACLLASKVEAIANGLSLILAWGVPPTRSTLDKVLACDH